MFAKKAVRSNLVRRGYRKQLEHLYARRSTLDTLIQSLEDYDRFRSVAATARLKRKSA
jgi:hypothetical protein